MVAQQLVWRPYTSFPYQSDTCTQNLHQIFFWEVIVLIIDSETQSWTQQRSPRQKKQRPIDSASIRLKKHSLDRWFFCEFFKTIPTFHHLKVLENLNCVSLGILVYMLFTLEEKVNASQKDVNQISFTNRNQSRRSRSGTCTMKLDHFALTYT